MMLNVCLQTIAFVLVFGNCYSQAIRCNDAELMNIGKFKNLYSISSKIFRSEQPVSEDWNILAKEGVTTVINLRHGDTDAKTVKDTALRYIHLPMKAYDLDYNKVVECLKIIKDSKGTCLIHCLHGSDRTGCVIACCRIVFCGWSKQKAIDEFLDERFGYHQFWFPGIKKFLEEIDVEKLKNDVYSETGK